EEVMALSDVAFARLLVDPAVPRHEIIRLSAGAQLGHGQADDPLLLAADAAPAAAFGFREIETTVPVLAAAPSNTVACLIGATVAAPGVLIQCSVEEAQIGR